MKISALDIRKQEFARTFRGYDAEEVDSFLQIVATGWQEMVDDLRRTNDKVQEQQLKLEHYMKVEEALEEALQTARTSARQTIESAERKANAMLEEAENKIVAMQREADSSRLEIKRETARYSVRQQEIVAKLRSFLVSEMEMLRHFESETSDRKLTGGSAAREIELIRDERAEEAATAGQDEIDLDDVFAGWQDPQPQAEEEEEEGPIATPQGSWEEEEDDEDSDDDLDYGDDDDDDDDDSSDDDEEWEEDDDEWDDEDEDDDDDLDYDEDEDDDEEGPLAEEASPSWRVTPVFESVEPADDDSDDGEPDGNIRMVSDESADDEIRKIHEILKGLDEEQDGAGS